MPQKQAIWLCLQMGSKDLSYQENIGQLSGADLNDMSKIDILIHADNTIIFFMFTLNQEYLFFYIASKLILQFSELFS